MNAIFPPWLDAILCDPETKQPLQRHGDAGFRSDRQCYPVRDGILSAVFPELLTGEDARCNRFYERFAPYYEWTQRVLGRLISGSDATPEQLWRRDVIARLGLQPASRVLEVSPGPGVVQRLLRERIGEKGELVALDLSKNMLRQCQKRGDGNACLIHGNGQHLPFADNSFDALFHFGGINLFNHPAKAIEEFVRVVRKDGILAWGDEGFSPSHPDGMKKKILTWMNPGYLRARPAIPDTVTDVKTYEVFFGFAYLVVGKKK
jgi:ubiquinone/menaquinone biosynthesis C-methylase UbiE